MVADFQAVEDLFNTCKPLLPHYLAMHGVQVDTRGHFKCFAHDDTHPSANLIPGSNGRQWHCHSCGCRGDIFDAAHYLEGLPPSGSPGFYKENVIKIAEDFHIPVPETGREPDEKTIQETRFYRAHADALRVILTGGKSDLVRAKLAEYGWTKRTVNLFGIGGVESYDGYLKAMAERGWTRDYLASVGLDDRRIFSDDCLIYAVKDDFGKIIAFSARNLRFKELSDAYELLKAEKGREHADVVEARKRVPAKYVNSAATRFDKASGQTVPVNTIYRKGTRLYGFQLAREAASLYVFEGYADVVTAYDKGLKGAVAVCSTGFSKEHLDLALGAGFKHIVYAMDADEAGDKGVRAFAGLCEKHLAGRRDVRLEIMAVPAGDDDPDRYIRVHGMKAFMKLPRRHLIHWKALDAMARYGDPVLTAWSLVPEIQQLPTWIERANLAHSVADAVGLPREAVWLDVLAGAGPIPTPAEAAKQEEPLPCAPEQPQGLLSLPFEHASLVPLATGEAPLVFRAAQTEETIVRASAKPEPAVMATAASLAVISGTWR